MEPMKMESVSICWKTEVCLSFQKYVSD